jgi:hypothetical protein
VIYIMHQKPCYGLKSRTDESLSNKLKVGDKVEWKQVERGYCENNEGDGSEFAWGIIDSRQREYKT